MNKYTHQKVMFSPAAYLHSYLLIESSGE